MTLTLSIPTTSFLPNIKRLLNRKNFPLLSKARLFFVAIAIHIASQAEIRKLRTAMIRNSSNDEPSVGIGRILNNSKKVRDHLYAIHSEFENLDGLYFTKRHIKAALTDWDDLVEDLTAFTDMEFKALSKDLAGLFR